MNPLLENHVLWCCPNITKHVVRVAKNASQELLFQQLQDEIGLIDFAQFSSILTKLVIDRNLGFVVTGSCGSRVVISESAGRDELRHEWLHYYFRTCLTSQQLTDLLNFMILKHQRANLAFVDLFNLLGVSFDSRLEQSEEIAVRILNGDWYVGTRDGKIPVLRRDYPALLWAQFRMSLYIIKKRF